MRRAAALCALLCLALAACSPAPAKQSSTLFAMDTVMELQLYGDGTVLAESTRLITELEKELSATDPEGGVYAFNHTGTELGKRAAELFLRAMDISRLTGGAMDITVYPVVLAWGFTTGQYRVPGDEEIAALLEKVGYTKSSGFGLPQGAMIDLGAVAKGYTSDLIADLWRQRGISSGLMNLGGNVYALGKKPDGSPWLVGVRDPFSDTFLGTVEAKDVAVVTSGAYERYFERDGVIYHHIIDPKTGRPAKSGLASVTVIGPDGTLCDGLSTAFFVLGLDRAAEIWKSCEADGASPDFDVLFVTDGGEIYITEGLEGSFSPTNDYDTGDVRVIRRG